MAYFTGKDNFYQILYVSTKASYETIKEAYRRLALQTHPDRNGGPNATASFQLVGKAWETLKDKDKRAAYDQTYEHERERAKKQEEARTAEQDNKRRGSTQRRHIPMTISNLSSDFWVAQNYPQYANHGNRRTKAHFFEASDNTESSRPYYYVEQMAYYDRRLENIERELDALDEDAANEVEIATEWGWREGEESWRTEDMEDEYQFREYTRQERLEDIRVILKEKRRFQNEFKKRNK